MATEKLKFLEAMRNKHMINWILPSACRIASMVEVEGRSDEKRGQKAGGNVFVRSNRRRRTTNSSSSSSTIGHV
jgi:hypothetical protein